MTREQLRQRIDAMERLHDLLAAIDDLTDLPADQTIDLTFNERSLPHKSPISTVHSLPHELVFVGLRAMAKSIEEQLAREAIPA